MKKEFKFTITGRLPGMNEYTSACRTNPHKGAAMKRDSQYCVEWSIRLAERGIQLQEPVKIEYVYYEPNQRRDKDNISSFAHKVIQDALVSQGVLKNDGWKNILGSSDEYHVDKNEPRIEVRLISIDTA